MKKSLFEDVISEQSLLYLEHIVITAQLRFTSLAGHGWETTVLYHYLLGQQDRLI